MWKKSSCIPVYQPRNITTGLQAVSMSTNGQDFSILSMPMHYYNESSVFHVHPTFGAVTGGTVVTVTGPPDFIPSPECLCRFDRQLVATTITASSVRCLSPRVPSGRTVSFAIALDGQHFACVPHVFNGQCSYMFFEKVKLSRVFPSIGSTVGGTRITVSGQAFLQVPTATCQFGAVTTNFAIFDGARGVCVAPAAAAAGMVQFAVTINGIDQEILQTGFLFYLVPELSSLVPNGAALEGGSSITVVGKNFKAFVDYLVLCRFTVFGANEAASVIASVVAATSVVCPAPPRNSSGSYTLQVSLIGKGSVADLVAIGDEWSHGLIFVYYLLPSMLALKPSTGGKLGGTALLAILSTSVNLHTFARCLFQVQGGKSVFVQANFVSLNAVGCAAPAFEQVQDKYPSVRVALNGQDLTATQAHVFTYVNEPVASLVAPTMTTANGGTILKLTGSNFVASFWASCVFRGPSSSAVPATAVVPATVVSSTEARCESPRLSIPGVYELTVSPSDSFEGTPLLLPVAEGASVVRLLPSHGLVRGATSVTLVGTGFAMHKTPICLFGLRMVRGERVDTSHIVCDSPPSPLERLFQVQVIVSLDAGVSYFNTTQSYEYYPLLRVLDFYPQVGVIQGGTTVTVSAAGVRNVAGITCRFGSRKVAATISSNSANGEAVLMCMSPLHPEGLVNFAVSHNGQDAEFALASSLYTFHRPLVATGMWPSAGPIAGGTLVTLTADQGSRTIYPMDLDFVQRATLLPPDPMPSSRWVFCKIGHDTVPGRQVADGIECMVTACTNTPTVNASGMVRQMEVSINGQEFVASDLLRFLCADMPIVDRVVPSLGASEVGGPITMYGRHFTGTTHSRCAVGNLSSAAIVVNSTLAYCDASPIVPMNISGQSRELIKTTTARSLALGVVGKNWVTLAADGQHYSNDKLGHYTYYPSASVRMIQPASASTSQGPVTVTVFGSGFRPHDNTSALCRFGSVVVTAVVNTAEILECTAPAVTIGCAVLVELSFNSRDFERHNTVFFLRLAPAPQVDSVTFLDSLNVLKIRWLNATDRAIARSSTGTTHCGVNSQQPCGVVSRQHLVGPFQCGEVIQVNDLALGYGALCRWRDNSTMLVSLGAMPTLIPLSRLSLLPSAVMQGSQLSEFSASQLPSIQLPSAPHIPTPVPIIVAPTAVGSCEDMRLDASMSYNHGGRPLNFSWTLVSPAPFSQNITRVLQAFSGPDRDPSRTACMPGVCSILVIPSALLTPQDYTFQLAVTSWFGRSASTTQTITKLRAANTPSVRILAASALQIRAGQQLELQALVSEAVCSALTSTVSVSLEWSVKERLAPGALSSDILLSSSTILRTSPVLRLPPHTLRSNTVYSIQVSAFTPDGATATAASTLTVGTGSLVAWISGGDRLVAHDQDLWLDASASFDPDANPTATNIDPLIFAWRCEMQDSAMPMLLPSSCDVLGSNFTVADAAQAVTYLPLGSADVGRRMCSAARNDSQPAVCTGASEFVFTVSVSRADGSGVSTAVVRVRLERALHNTTVHTKTCAY